MKRNAPKLQTVTTGRRFSEAISEGEGISVIAEVDGPEAARRAEQDGADALLAGGGAGRVAAISEATSLPILFPWAGEQPTSLEGVDACAIDAGRDRDREWLEQVHRQLADRFELALRIDDEEHLELVLEDFDPELFILAASDDREEDEPLDAVLDLLPDVPAGKLAIAELPVTTREDVLALERAGIDGVIVNFGNIAELVGGEPPEV